ncbi:NAD(P)H-dependent amine dehydrogenase family protein [Nocardioides massiliensis]|uniref:Dihydrodipicolinate reductase n=1 Tax=Nocardioides massiliensis TaxID=1325935 RepID=A0ABT9NKS8_9ACTN|nr:dihydrodipicolinate reductase [Nocardioides massiliensis]MDP9820445.1 hypothetical protein [Nocardioides massiliensis]
MTLRVAQWATGAVGREAVLGVLGAPGLELVAVKVHGSDKVGVDAGELVGLPPLGVRTTQDLAELLAAAPDCVVYTPRVAHVAEVADLLRAGVDVVTTAFCFHPARMSAADRAVLEQAAYAGGATLHGSGLNPGNFGMAVPLALSGLVRELRTVSLVERADWSAYESTRITFDNMRFGAPPAQVDEGASEFLAFNADLFRQQVWLIGDALGAELDEVVTEHSVGTATEPIPVFDRTIAPGTVNAQRWTWTGRARGTAKVVVDCLWSIGAAPADWPRAQHGWTVQLEGEPSVQAHLTTLASFAEPRSLADHVRAASAATAMQVVNAIPAVCAAAPGFATAESLPLVRSLQGFRPAVAAAGA